MLRFLHIDDDALRDWLMAPEEHPPPPDYWPKFETPEQYAVRFLAGERLRVRYRLRNDRPWAHVAWFYDPPDSSYERRVLLDFAQNPDSRFHGHRGGSFLEQGCPNLPGNTGWYTHVSSLDPMEN